MKALSLLTGAISALWSIIVLRPFESYQAFLVKSTATANTPALSGVGALVAALGLRYRSLPATILGLFSSLVGATYIRLNTQEHDGFARAFGQGWQDRIPPTAKHHMLTDRVTWRLPRVPEPRWTRDIPFATVPGTDRHLLADVWEPASGVERSGTVIVYLYGGSWHFFDKDVLTRPLFRQLTARGHVVMDAAHRSCPETDVGGMVGDVHRAVAWIKAHAEQYGVDPGKIVVMGGSSGAHIALLAGLAPDDPVFKPEELRDVDTAVMGIISWYGIPEMRACYRRWKGQEAGAGEPPARLATPSPQGRKIADAFMKLFMGRTLTPEQSPPGPPVDQLMRNLLGGLPDEVPEMTDRASPVRRVSPSSPPTLMFQGTHDAVVPLDSARELHRTLERAGVPAVYVELPWTEHAFDLMYPPLGNPAAKAALYDVERFLALIAATG